MNKGLFFRYLLVILLSFCIFRAAWWAMPNICGVWELQVSDQLMRLAYQWQGKREISPDIVHVDLDDHSVSSIPYSKNDPRLYTELIQILAASGAKVILVDMLFPNCREDSCRQLAAAVGSAGNVYFPVILTPLSVDDNAQSADSQPPDKATRIIGGQKKPNPGSGKILLSNYRALNDAAAGLGHINFSPDTDGVYRRLPLFFSSRDDLVPALALRAICDYLGISPANIRFNSSREAVLPSVTLPQGSTLDIRIPVDRKARNRVNFSGPWQDSFVHYSFATILNRGATPAGQLELTDELEDALVIVSDVSTGGRDYGPIPLSSYSPLSGLHGHFINSILTNDFLTETGFKEYLLFDLALVALLIAGALSSTGYRFALIAGVLYCGFTAACLYLFLEHRVLLPMVRPSMSFILAVLSIMLFQFLEVQKEKQYIRATLTSYFAPSLMEKILHDPELIKGVAKKELTILFSDIVGFSSWSSTRDAREIHQTLNRYFEEMATIVFAHQGTIDKYIGDGLMVFFGDPTPCPDHALRAVKTAQAMQKKTRELKEEWRQSGGMVIEIRIGIHCGEVVVGNMGSRDRMDYTVIGSNVNLAQRLESNCPPGSIMISEQVCRQLDRGIAAKAAGTIRAKGFADPVPVYTVDPE